MKDKDFTFPGGKNRKASKLVPFIAVENNVVVGLVTTNRKPMYENEMCKSVGLMATCNACDRIIFEDEKWKKEYSNNGGYCKECADEIKETNHNLK